MVKCKRCGSDKTVKNGKVREKQRYLCKQCGCHFVEGDERENKHSAIIKTLCKVFKMLGSKKYKTIGEFLNRDTSLIHRWMNEESFNHHHYGDFSTICYSPRKLAKELEDGGITERKEPFFLAQNVVGDWYVAVIAQPYKKR